MLTPVIRVYSRNADLYVSALEASIALDGRLPATLLLTHDSDYDPSLIFDVASRAFTDVKVIPFDPVEPNQPWPLPQNITWQQVARWIDANHASSFKRFLGWLWWEADACPIRAGWLTTLTAAYKKSRCLFAGVACQLNGEFYMNGVGIYPGNVVEALAECSAFYCRTTPFDIAAGSCVSHSFSNFSSLMIHEKKPSGGAVGIPYNRRRFDNLLATHRVAVFHHGCADGTLHLLAAGKELPAPVVPTFVPARKPDTLSLMQVLTRWREGVKEASPDQLRYVHCVERHKQRNPTQEPRIERAFMSWVTVYANPRFIPCHVWDYPRSSATLGDPRSLPYLKDIFIEAMTRARPQDVIVWTNDDTLLHPEIVSALDTIMSQVDACASMRLNFEPGQVPPLTEPIDTFNFLGKRCLGRDLFAFRKSWLLKYWHEIPDFLLGELEFDLVLTVLIRKSINVFSDRKNINEPCPACELPNGYVLHEMHERAWMSQAFSESPAKRLNQALSISFYHRNDMVEMAPVF